VALPAVGEPTVVEQRGERALDLPAPDVAAKRPAILGAGPSPVRAVRSNQLDPPFLPESPIERIAVMAKRSCSRKTLSMVPSTSVTSCREALAIPAAMGSHGGLPTELRCEESTARHRALRAGRGAADPARPCAGAAWAAVARWRGFCRPGGAGARGATVGARKYASDEMRSAANECRSPSAMNMYDENRASSVEST
jgi:hypothetical protein